MNKAVLISVVAVAFPAISSGQLIVSNDATAASARMFDIDPTGGRSPITLVSGAEAQAWGMAYDTDTNYLYWNNGGTFRRAQYTPGPLTVETLPSLTFNGSTSNVVSMAYWNGMLVGTRNITTEAVYQINPGSGAMTLLGTYNTSFDFGGLDSDGTTLYGLTDAAPTGSTRGLYTLDIAGGVATPTFVPGSLQSDTDVDGLAIGAGKAFFVNDSSTQNIFVFDLATNTFETPIPTGFLANGTFSAGAYVVPEPVSGIAMAGLAGFALRRRGR